MRHCHGEPGANDIGNRGFSPPASLGPEENAPMTIVRWVGEGIALDMVAGTAWVNGTQSAGLNYKRRHCRWPLRNVYRALAA
jgi:hypothetical protein